MGAAARLTILRDGEVVKNQPLEGEVDVGRAEGCAIRLEDRAISRHHALFRPVGDGFQVEKRSEFGPLSVNGAECTRAFLKEGDVIEIGPYLVRYSAGEGAVSAGIGGVAPGLTSFVPPVEAVTQALMQPESPSPPPTPSQLGEPVALDLLGATAPLPQGLSPTEAAAAQMRAETGATGLGAPPAGGLDLDAPDMLVPPLSSDVGGLVLDAPGGSNSSLSTTAPIAESGGPAGGGGDLSISLSMSGASLEGGTSSSSVSTGPVDPDAATKVYNSSDLKVRLLLKSGVASATEFDIEKDEISIGRGRDCEIIVDDKKVSRKNTIIRREGNKYVIKDLESANGTHVNGTQVKEAQLYGDDIVKIGNTEFKFVALSENYAKRESEFSQIAAAAAGVALTASASSSASELAVPDINLPPPIEGGGYSAPVDLSGLPRVVDVPSLAVPSNSELLNAPPIARPESSGLALTPPPPNAGMSGLFSAGYPPGLKPPGERTVNVLGIPGLPGNIPGVAVPGKAEKGLMARFRRLPKRMQWIVILVVIAGCWTLLWDDDEFNVPPPQTKKVRPKPSAKPTTENVSPTFDNLSPEKKRFVEAQHNLAFDYYRNKDYAKALYEIQKIFDIIPDYKDSREIERYSKEGKRKQDAIEEEQRKKEEEARLKAKIQQFVDEIQLRMSKKQYEQAREIFPKILALDPDNAQVAGWKKEIEDWEEKEKLAQQEKQIQKEINDRAYTIYKRGLTLKARRRYHTAVVLFSRLVEDGTSDKRLSALARRQISACRGLIARRRVPVFAAAEAAEKNGEFSKAMKLYSRAAAIDPSYGASAAGLERCRKVLHEKAKVIYTEAVLAESYSDFDTAKAKYKEIVGIAPSDDIYFERATRKLGRYFQRGVAQE